MAAGLFGPAEVIAVDSVAHRLELARRLGATAIEVGAAHEAILQRTSGRGADVAIEAVSDESALAEALAALRPGGTLW